MKNIKKFILGVLVALMCCSAPVSCIKIFDQDIQIVHVWTGGQSGETPDGAIHFGNYTPATKAASPMTKAMAGEGPNGVGYGDFKIYGWEDGTAFMDPFNVEWQNNEWVYEGVDSQELQYFNRSADQYDFVGIISDKVPTRTDQTVNIANVEAFQTDDAMNSPKEILYTQKTILPAEYNQYVTLTFNHANARMFLGFASDRDDTEIIDYAPGTSVPGTLTTEHAKMFDLLAEGKLVGYGLIPNQGDYNGYYAGFEGNFFNLNPYHGAYNYVSKSRLAELMPLVNAQFIYTDAECNLVDKWEYGVDKKDKMFLKFAPGVDAAEFIAGNDAFWNNLTDGEKAALQKYKDSGCRVIRIEELPDGNYFAWGESYALASWVSPTSTERDFKIINGGTIGRADLEGIRVFSVDDSGAPIIHKVHTDAADAHVTVSALTWDNVVASSNVMLFNKPATVVAQAVNTSIAWADATPSPTIRYALPVENTGYVVKFSYTYNGVSYYDARVLVPTASANFVESKDYTYVIYITDKTNATTDPDQAADDKNEVDTTLKAIVFSQVDFSSYTSGGHYVYTVL